MTTKSNRKLKNKELIPVAREFAKGFYKSKAWKKTRQAYFDSQHGLCEKCRARGRYVPGEIVHHKIHLTPQNIDNPVISLNYNNLELVCRECHAAEHPEIYGEIIKPRVAFDENGNVVRLEGDNGR